MKQFLRSFLTLLMLVVWASGFAQSSLSVDFESDLTTYTDWTFKNIAQSATITPHSGTYYGDTSGKTTAYVQTKNKVEAPQQLTFYISKETKNNKTSNWRIQVSTDGKTWTDVKTVSATSMTPGKWFEVTQNLEKYKNNYVRVYYDGTAAIRCIDDITLTLGSSKTSTTLTFNKPTISIEEGNEATFTGQKATLKTGETVLDKAITYAYSGSEIFATFNTTTGDATLKTGVYGTATVTATYVGDKTYEKAVASYTVKVVNPNFIVLDATADKGTASSMGKDDAIEKGNIILTGTNIALNPNATHYKIYGKGYFTISAKEGVITKITINCKGSNTGDYGPGNFSSDIEGYSFKDKVGTWEGNATSVKFTNNDSKQVQVTSIEITK